MSEPMPSLYATTHRYLAAFLMAVGYPLLLWEKDNQYVSFHFEQTDGLPEDIQGFYNNSHPVKPQDFILGLDRVRAIIREANEKEEGKL